MFHEGMDRMASLLSGLMSDVWSSLGPFPRSVAGCPLGALDAFPSPACLAEGSWPPSSAPCGAFAAVAPASSVPEGRPVVHWLPS
eukprot:8828053-Pyramimonas_sp.AAC.1